MLSLLVILAFLAAMIPAMTNEPYSRYVSPSAEAGMHRNASGQTVCGHLNSSTGSDHTSGTVTVAYHANGSFTTDGTATHTTNGVWCRELSQAATNQDLAKILWTSTGAITLLQTYPTTGYSDNGTTVPANVTHVNGTAQTAADLGTIPGHLNGTLGAGTHSAQTGDAYDYVSSHLNGTIEDGSHLNSTAQAAAIDTQLSGTHGNGSWDATDGTAPTVEQIDAELSETHGPGPWAK